MYKVNFKLTYIQMYKCMRVLLPTVVVLSPHISPSKIKVSTPRYEYFIFHISLKYFLSPTCILINFYNEIRIFILQIIKSREYYFFSVNEIRRSIKQMWTTTNSKWTLSGLVRMKVVCIDVCKYFMWLLL